MDCGAAAEGKRGAAAADLHFCESIFREIKTQAVAAREKISAGREGFRSALILFGVVRLDNIGHGFKDRCDLVIV